MSRRLISSGSTFEAEIGYSRAVVDGDWVFVSGTTGFDYRTMTIRDGVAEQAEQCLLNIGAALAEAGASFADVVRVTYVLPKADDFPACWPVLRKYFGEARPAAMMLVVVPRGKVVAAARAGRPVVSRAAARPAAWRPAARSSAAPCPASNSTSAGDMCTTRTAAQSSSTGGHPCPGRSTGPAPLSRWVWHTAAGSGSPAES